MKAITQAGYGGPDQLALTEHPEPKVGPGEVLIEVKAAGVNPVDWKLGAGYLDSLMEVQFPLVPGWDVAGVVTALGPDVPEFAVGDEVYGYIRKDSAHLGAYAERVSASVRMLARKPAALSWAQAAGVPLAGLTALQSIDRVEVTAGDTVLIHGASGGVGSLGVQIAVARGARVIGTASERNHEFLRSLGAEPVTYGDGLADRVRALAPEGVDVVLDFVGGGAVHASAEVHRTPSRLVSIADGDAAELGGHALWARPDAARLAELARLADEGKLTVHVEHELPLAEAARAWELSQEGRTRGKIVLTV
ncbi:NADP-dependent oxidoreductase [Amycolatopsis sp. YIM 10]|uniref:NADP-dependent oxidoreductase n=1 Tax=Amycolatopsis sp. YIM 10 TaxID=2653857 RepID=UPI0012906332|nr:NADP-dependent oxidoreductase [Amycolatopsis sp. YIM 10]QFU90334.1 Phenolphthiocerol synthesis polyketide synthase type I Pks15/1 [Amycolatopsis sp. YIM 10]